MAARFAIEGVLKFVHRTVPCLRRALNSLGTYIKLRKFPRKSKRREKNRHLTPDFRALQEAVRKILDAGMLKF